MRRDRDGSREKQKDWTWQLFHRWLCVKFLGNLGCFLNFIILDRGKREGISFFCINESVSLLKYLFWKVEALLCKGRETWVSCGVCGTLAVVGDEECSLSSSLSEASHPLSLDPRVLYTSLFHLLELPLEREYDTSLCSAEMVLFLLLFYFLFLY